MDDVVTLKLKREKAQSHIELKTGWNISLDFRLFTFGNVMEEMHCNCFQILGAGRNEP